MSTTCSLGLIIVPLLTLAVATVMFLLAMKLLGKHARCTRHKALPTFYSRCVSKYRNCKTMRFEDILWRFLNCETANSRVFF